MGGGNDCNDGARRQLHEISFLGLIIVFNINRNFWNSAPFMFCLCIISVEKLLLTAASTPVILSLVSSCDTRGNQTADTNTTLETAC
jgi:hypothetical protein